MSTPGSIYSTSSIFHGSSIPLIDEFGQWIPDEWPDKAKSLSDLEAAWKTEENLLKTGNPGISKYGGYLSDRGRASGFFRTEKINGKWWFVDPDGYLFFSTGCCVMSARSSFDRIEGREYLFKSLPPGELVQSDKRISASGMYAWNLYHRFGPDWYQKWMEMTARRMDDWGLNTIGSWSDTNLGRNQKKAYVITLSGWGFDPKTMGMPDVYANDYNAVIDAAAERQCAPLKDDPYLLGYFVGNEPPWPGREQELVNVILAGDETPMKKALKDYLAGGDTPEQRKTFVYNTYIKFITAVNDAIRKHDPNHLNLGFRFGGNPPEDLIKASAKVGFDVFSLNIYEYSVPEERITKMADITRLPIIIGEFHFGVPERGLAPGLAQTLNQEERGVAYRYYVENAAAIPSIIGTHWFQWWDQPATGRFDGENYNIGFVNVTDRPYKELIEATRETHKRLRDIHAGKVLPVTRQALIW